jgi:type I restriction enzyme R subunit
MYRIVRESYEHQVLIDKEFSKKTAKLVQDHTRSGRIEESLEIYELDEDLLRKIQESQASDVEKVFNLVRTIEREVGSKGAVQPFLIPIGEKAERIIEDFKARQISTEEALERLGEIITETNEAREERAEKDIPDEVFSIYWTLRQEGLESAEAIASEMLPVMEEFPHYDSSEAQEREIKKALYRVILGTGEKDVKRVKVLVDTVIRVLQGGRRES